MFWIFRKRKPLQPAHFYLDVAAGILQNRGKCEGRLTDDWGRVDVLGAIRLAVWGSTDYDLIYKRNRTHGPELWHKYVEVKELLYSYIAQKHPDYPTGKGKSFMNPDLHEWSDKTTPHTVVAWMRQAAWEAKGRALNNVA